MTEEEYAALLDKAEDLIKSVREFPAHELNAFAAEHHPEDKSFTSKVWGMYLEAGGE